MAGQLKNAIAVLVLITAANRFITADEGPNSPAKEAPTADGQENATSAVQEASPEAERTTQRGGESAGVYPAELCNPFYQFWEKHQLLWTLRTSDSLVFECKRQELNNSEQTGVTLTELRLWLGKTLSKNYFWKFGTDGSMYLDYESCYSSPLLNYCTALQMKAFFEYESPENNCSVVRLEEWYYRSEEGKRRYNENCNTKNLTDCACNSTGNPEPKKAYLCLNTPFHELVLHDEPKDNAPKVCQDEYNQRRIKYRQADRPVYTKGCEAAQKSPTT